MIILDFCKSFKAVSLFPLHFYSWEVPISPFFSCQSIQICVGNASVDSLPQAGIIENLLQLVYMILYVSYNHSFSRTVRWLQMNLDKLCFCTLSAFLTVSSLFWSYFDCPPGGSRVKREWWPADLCNFYLSLGFCSRLRWSWVSFAPLTLSEEGFFSTENHAWKQCVT